MGKYVTRGATRRPTYPRCDLVANPLFLTLTLFCRTLFCRALFCLTLFCLTLFCLTLFCLTASRSTLHAQSSHFIRGDTAPDKVVDVNDAVQIFRFLFTGTEIVHGRCLDALDVDDSNAIDFADGVQLLHFVVTNTRPPSSPFPDCAGDPSNDELGCLVHEPCDIPSRIVFVIDRSSRTCNGDLAIWKRETLRVIHNLSSEDEFSILFYDRGLTSFPERGMGLLKATPFNKHSAINFSTSTLCGSGSCVKGALLDAVLRLGARGEIQLVGVGCPPCLGSDPTQYVTQTLTELQEQLEGKDITVEMIQVGDNCSELGNAIEERGIGTVTHVER